MQTSFDIALSRAHSPEELAGAIGELVPSGLRIDVCADAADLPNEHGALCAVVVASDDPAWPCVLDVFGCSDEIGLGSFPDLRLAAHLCEHFGMDALCGTYPFVGALHPHDPYWSLAHIDSRWYLVSTVETRLMRESANGTVKVVREVEVPAA